MKTYYKLLDSLLLHFWKIKIKKKRLEKSLKSQSIFFLKKNVKKLTKTKNKKKIQKKIKKNSPQ